MFEHPWDSLIHAHLDDALDEAGRAEFNEVMAKKLTAVHRRFWELAEIHTLSHEAYRIAFTAPEPLPIHFARKPHRCFRPCVLASVAAVVLLAVLATSILACYSRLAKHQLPVAYADFEGTALVVRKKKGQKMPSQIGVWTGAGEIVGARQGMLPRQGSQMIRYLLPNATLSKNGDDAMVCSAGVMQLIDMRAWRSSLANGRARVEWSAFFNGMTDPVPRRTSYRISVWAYTRNVPRAIRSATALQQNPLTQGLAKTSYKTSWIMGDNDPARWQLLTGSMQLPPDTDFLAIDLRVFQKSLTGVLKDVTDSWQFMDEVQLSLFTSTSTKPIALLMPDALSRAKQAGQELAF